MMISAFFFVRALRGDIAHPVKDVWCCNLYLETWSTITPPKKKNPKTNNMSPEKWPLKYLKWTSNQHFSGDMLIFEDGIRSFHFSIFVLKGKTACPSLFQSRSQNPVWNQCSPPRGPMNQQAPVFSKNQRYQQQTTPLVEYSVHDSIWLSFKMSGPPPNGGANAKIWPIVCFFVGTPILTYSHYSLGVAKTPVHSAFNQSSGGPPVLQIFTDSAGRICGKRGQGSSYSHIWVYMWFMTWAGWPRARLVICGYTVGDFRCPVIMGIIIIRKGTF